ncbi:MAG: trypsin-like peptidase domain-containing protein [Nitrososphaeraceae archaeon]|nr:trypsin-like peptidase domain-containing protein [Nitrososphaeraceae archaeon]
MQYSKLTTIETAIIAFIIIATIVVLPVQHLIIATAQSIPPRLPTQPSTSLTNIFKQTQNSIVLITAPPLAKNQNVSFGAGFIYDKNGHILTAKNVLDGTRPPIDIMFADGNSYSAHIIGKDPYSDLAVLQLDKSALSQERIQPLRMLSNSSTLEVGQPVVLIGYPYGLSFSLTGGMISGLNRLIPKSGFSIPGGIQIDGIINPGDSGPVQSLDGKVIGLMAQVLSGNNSTFTGINFAIPSNNIQKIVPQLIATGSYKHPWLGINGATITPDFIRAMGLKNNQTKGVIVGSVAKGSPAYTAGILGGKQTTIINGQNHTLGGDIVIGVDNKQIRNIEDLISYVDISKSVGDTIVLKVLRNGTIHNIDVKLTERPSLPS